MSPRLTAQQGVVMIRQFEAQRASLLCQALEDSKKWCVAPDSRVGTKRYSDQYWLQLLSSSTELLTDQDVHEFLVSFQLETRFVQFNERDVLARIIALSVREMADLPTAVDALAEELMGTISSSLKGRQTSAASKLVFFGWPRRDVYIWDAHARRAARFREWMRLGGGTRPPRFDGSYIIGRVHDYSSYSTSCAEALKEECQRGDFITAIKDFRGFLDHVGGPMAGCSVMESSFIERRFLDKLMFWEGHWLKDYGVCSEPSSETECKSETNKFNKKTERNEVLITGTRIGRSVKRGSGSIIDVIMASLESGLSRDQVVEKCMPLYLINHPDKAVQPDFKKWVAVKVNAQINWAKKNKSE
jgi:hypothetical protein